MSTKSMVWKEWRQNRALFFYMSGACLTLAFAPTLMDSLRSGHPTGHLEAPVSVVLFVGPFLALIAGISALGREQGRVEAFWRSRPMSLRTWLLAKYGVGLGIVLGVCVLVLLLERVLLTCVDIRGGGVGYVLKTHAFFLLLMYSVSFFMGVLVRGTINAAILAIATILIFIMAPLILPPLQWMSINMIGDLAYGRYGGDWRLFITVVTTLSGLLLWLSGVILKRRIQFSVDQRILCGLVVMMLLLFVAAVAFPLGTNMAPEQKIVLPRQHRGYVHNVIPDADQAWLLYSDGPELSSSRGRKFVVARVDLKSQEKPIRQTVVVADPGSEEGVTYSVRDLMWSKKRPSLAYVLRRKTQRVEGNQDYQRSLSLCTIALDQSQANPIIHRISLDNEMDGSLYTQACLIQQRIYVYDFRRMLVYSLEESKTPVLLHGQDIDSTGPRKRYGAFLTGSKRGSIKLLPVSQLADQGRLAITQQFCGDGWHLSGNQQVVLDGHRRNAGFTLYTVGSINDGTVTLAKQGRQSVRPVDRLLDFILYPHEILTHNEQLFCMNRYGVTVYDVTDPNHIQRLGHYGAGEAFVCMAPLEHDRMIIGGENLHILKLPDAGN
jgi:hypothetical protein